MSDQPFSESFSDSADQRENPVHEPNGADNSGSTRQAGDLDRVNNPGNSSGASRTGNFQRRYKPGSLRNAFAHLPINKGPRERQSTPRLPQINSPVIVAALSVATSVGKALTQNLRRVTPVGREQQLRAQLLKTFKGIHAAPIPENMQVDDLKLRVREAFGKPTLVSADLVVEDVSTSDEAAHPNETVAAETVSGNLAPEAGQTGEQTAGKTTGKTAGKSTSESADERSSQAANPIANPAAEVLLRDAFSRLVERIWDNPLIAPVAIRARIIHRDSQAPEVALMDMTDLGYADEIARPEDLYENYGPPAADPKWRP